MKPIDEKLLHKIFKTYSCIITIEDGCIQGGMGSAILEFAARNNYLKKNNLGVPDKFIQHGSLDQQKKNVESIQKI